MTITFGAAIFRKLYFEFLNNIIYFQYKKNKIFIQIKRRISPGNKVYILHLEIQN